MKKYLTLANVCKAVALVFGLVAFFMMFADQLYVTAFSATAYVASKDALFGNGGAVISFIGYLLVLIASLGVCALPFLPLDEKIKKLCAFALAAVMILAAVFIFIEASVVNGNSNLSAYHLAAGPVIAGIFSIIAALATAASELVHDKALVK
ncbi:MAG: hypothetical protein J5762_04635 [Clostridia bacterium]|nr:hypothetical protein [Clostridia bacterium]